MKRSQLTWIFTFVATGAVVSLLSGCAGMHRSDSSGYSSMGADDQGQRRDSRMLEREKTADELGFHSATLNDQQSEALETRTALNRLEKSLSGKREREQYYKSKPYMKNDQERIEFLSIESFEGRGRWLNTKGIQGSSTAHPSHIQALIDVNDITLGMTKQAVKDSWGEPELVEVAGNPVYGNERWHYSEQISSAEGFQTEHRLVYFESGRVAGWEKR
jgi:hypothetical protein